MAVSVTSLTLHLQAMMPKGYTVTTTPFTTWITEAIAKTMAVAGPLFRERTYVDCIGDGVTTRYALPGFDSALVPINEWPFPHTANTLGVAAPVAAPTLALRTGGSTIPSGAVLSFAHAWTDGTGETKIGPTASITTTAANQTVDVTVPAAPVGVTKAHLFATIAVLNPAHLGRVATAVAVSNTVTTTTTGLGLGAATVATWPLVDYVDPSTVSITEDSGLPRIEWNEDVTGRVPSDLTPAGVQSVVMFDTALTSGQRCRVWYTRDAQLPAATTSAILGVPDDVLYTGVEAHMYQTLALNHEDTAADKYWNAYLDSHSQFLNLLATQAGRPTTGARTIHWSTQTI